MSSSVDLWVFCNKISQKVWNVLLENLVNLEKRQYLPQDLSDTDIKGTIVKSGIVIFV